MRAMCSRKRLAAGLISPLIVNWSEPRGWARGSLQQWVSIASAATFDAPAHSQRIWAKRVIAVPSLSLNSM